MCDLGKLTHLHGAITRFYAKETALLDDGDLKSWLKLFADDIRYTMPMRESVQGEDAVDLIDREGLQFYLFNDDKESLELRVERLYTGLAPGETPPSVTQRLVTDILLTDTSTDEVEVRSSFLVFQVRHDFHETIFAGRRMDRLRPMDDDFQIARRKILLAQSVLPRTVSIFF
jgi:3-phenylpropionate/cinnamic acid dioxygenase small subunit